MSDGKRGRAIGVATVISNPNKAAKAHDTDRVCNSQKLVAALSVQVEIHLNVHGHRHWLAIFFARFKKPGFHFFHGLLIQTHA